MIDYVTAQSRGEAQTLIKARARGPITTFLVAVAVFFWAIHAGASIPCALFLAALIWLGLWASDHLFHGRLVRLLFRWRRALMYRYLTTADVPTPATDGVILIYPHGPEFLVVADSLARPFDPVDFTPLADIIATCPLPQPAVIETLTIFMQAGWLDRDGDCFRLNAEGRRATKVLRNSVGIAGTR